MGLVLYCTTKTNTSPNLHTVAGVNLPTNASIYLRVYVCSFIKLYYPYVLVLFHELKMTRMTVLLITSSILNTVFSSSGQQHRHVNCVCDIQRQLSSKHLTDDHSTREYMLSISTTDTQIDDNSSKASQQPTIGIKLLTIYRAHKNWLH